MRRHALLLLVFVGAFLAFGCSEQAPAPPAPKKPKETVEAPIPKPGSVPANLVAQSEVTAPAYQYDPAQRRDPFKVLIEVRKPVMVEDEPLTPLQQVDLDQMRLSGVIVGKGEPMAMVSVPGGKSYILKKGIKVGRNHGVVVGVDADGVSVQEKYYDFAGDVRQSVQKIELPKREGAK